MVIVYVHNDYGCGFHFRNNASEMSVYGHEILICLTILKAGLVILRLKAIIIFMLQVVHEFSHFAEWLKRNACVR